MYVVVVAISCVNIESTTKRQFNGKPDTERSRSVHIIRCLHPSTPLRIQLIELFGVGSIFIFYKSVTWNIHKLTFTTYMSMMLMDISYICLQRQCPTKVGAFSRK